MDSPIKSWRTVDLLDMVNAIERQHPLVLQEKEYYLIHRAKGNDRGCLEWVGMDENTPLINQWMLENGFAKNEKVIYFVFF